MSPADDVMEMQGICAEVADLLGLPDDLKHRANEVRRLFGRDAFSWNRIYEFLRAKAHRVDGWEKDHARRVRAELRRVEKERKDAEHLTWLQCEIARHRASGQEFRGPHVDGLEHFLRLARGGDSALEVQTEDEDQSVAGP